MCSSKSPSSKITTHGKVGYSLHSRTFTRQFEIHIYSLMTAFVLHSVAPTNSKILSTKSISTNYPNPAGKKASLAQKAPAARQDDPHNLGAAFARRRCPQRMGRRPTVPALLLVVVGCALALHVRAQRRSPPRHDLSPPPAACEFDVVDAASLTVPDFEARYKGARPLLIRGAARAWTALSRWSEAYLRDTVLRPLQLNSSHDYLFRRLDAKTGKLVRTPPREHAMSPVHEGNSNHNVSTAPHPQSPPPPRRMYMEFDGDVWHNSTFRPLDDVDLRTLPWFASWTFEHYVSVGENDSGLFFHDHEDAWSALVRGRKRWLLMPPQSATHPPPLSFNDAPGKAAWRDTVLPNIAPGPDRPLACDQTPGDVVYVPRRWPHAVQNAGGGSAALTAAISAVALGDAAAATPAAVAATPRPARVFHANDNALVSVQRVGHAGTPLAVLDDVLAPRSLDALEAELRGRDDFYEGHANGVNFPGKVADLDWSVVAPLVKVLAQSPELAEHFPPGMLRQEDSIGGFASIFCNRQGWVHTDEDGTTFQGGIVPPAAVFHFGFPRTSSAHDDGETGTAFYREKSTGLERMSTIEHNRTEFCKSFPTSAACGNPLEPGVSAEPRDSPQQFPPANDAAHRQLFEETHRVSARRNRLIAYPKDVFHNAFVDAKVREVPCSVTRGRLAISLFFLQPGPSNILNAGDTTWRVQATQALAGEAARDHDTTTTEEYMTTAAMLTDGVNRTRVGQRHYFPPLMPTEDVSNNNER